MKVDYNGRMARTYDAGRSLGTETIGMWMDAATRHVVPGPDPILDLGAGTGRFSASLARAFGSPVVALEPARGMRIQAIERVAGTSVRVVGGAAQNLPLAANVVRAVWASQVLHHVDNLVAAAGEIARVLTPDGRLLVRGMYADLPDQWPLVEFFPGLLRVADEHFPTWITMQGDLEAGGFTLIGTEHVEQSIAGGLGQLLERTRYRADSGLALLSDDEFEDGLAALARAAHERPVESITEVLDLFVFALG